MIDLITAQGTGRLRHCFFGEYSAVISVHFGTREGAARALVALGAGWQHGAEIPEVLVWQGGYADLAALKARLQGSVRVEPCGRRTCRHGCRDADIDSLAHSIDYGPPFTLSVQYPHPDQLTLAI